MTETPGKLVLVRHGASEWNLKNMFTGWEDIAISDQGKEEAHKAAEKLKGTKFDVAYTSLLQRATETLAIILHDLNQDIPVHRDKALNERHYGELQGKNKNEMREQYGDEQVHLWRRSYDIAPPGGESLRDTRDRTLPYFTEKVLPELEKGKNVLIVAHGNSLRSIVMELEKLTPDEIIQVNIPTGVPTIYTFDSSLHVHSKSILE